MAPRRLLPVAVLLLAVPGCALLRPGPTPVDDGITVLAKVDGGRAGLGTEELAGRYTTVVEIADDEESVAAAWAESVPADLPQLSGEPREQGRYGSLDDLDLREQVLVLYSGGQSGSCPGWVADLSFDDGVLAVVETEHVPGDGCTDNFGPYRLILAVDRDKLPGADELPLAQVEKEGRQYDALVSAYPAAG